MKCIYLFIFTLYPMAIFSAELSLDGKISCVRPTEATRETVSGQVCNMQPSVKLPMRARSFLDLSQLNDRSKGTCSDFISRIPHGINDDELIQIDLFKLHREGKLPLLVQLPVIQKLEQGCAQLCELGNFQGLYKPTKFGIALKYARKNGNSTGPFVPDGFAPVVRAEAPWFIVVGNEGDAAPCMDGRPTVLEFGAPLASLALHYGGYIGFSTDKITQNPGYALIDIAPEDVANAPKCAPFKCEE
jgi:hypothetical protein